MTGTLTDMIKEHGLAPLYGSVIMTRVNGRMVITCAPSVALISPEVLFEHRALVRITDRSRVHISDQVVYRITGWNRDEQALIVLLEEDHR